MLPTQKNAAYYLSLQHCLPHLTLSGKRKLYVATIEGILIVFLFKIILCSLQSLKYRRQIISLVTLFKFIHFHPNYLEQFNIYITKSTRRPNKLVFNNHGRVLSSLFMHRIGNMWNCLPPSLTSLDNLSKFTCALRHFTLKYQFSCNGIPS